jgi:LmbE family N-acetylglucosaminyl deacetylase
MTLSTEADRNWGESLFTFERYDSVDFLKKERAMRVSFGAVVAAAILVPGQIAIGQGTAHTLVAVWAHADDEAPVGPVLARYAREGVKVYMIIATDGAQGAANTSVPRGPEIAKLRVDEARCSAQALGIQPPILLDFPDGELGHYIADRGLLFRLTQRIQEELERLRPDVIITWGPDGGSGHPDHRIISSVVTQLVRAGAAGVPQRVFYGRVNSGRSIPEFKPARLIVEIGDTRPVFVLERHAVEIRTKANQIPLGDEFVCARDMARPDSFANAI